MRPSWLFSFLLDHGWSDQDIRDIAFRHDISKLMAEAIGLGLNISPTTRYDIDLLSEAHKGFWPRYPKQTGGPIFLINQFEQPVVELLSGVALAIRSGNRLWVKY
jgi:hypothetical protein